MAPIGLTCFFEGFSFVLFLCFLHLLIRHRLLLLLLLLCLLLDLCSFRIWMIFIRVVASSFDGCFDVCSSFDGLFGLPFLSMVVCLMHRFDGSISNLHFLLEVLNMLTFRGWQRCANPKCNFLASHCIVQTGVRQDFGWQVFVK